MRSYVYGIAVSQFLWSTHYAMYSFYKRNTKKDLNIKNYLEIGWDMDYFYLKQLKDLKTKKILK